MNGHYECREQVKDWVGDYFRWRLCYRASEDGWSAEDFHTSCNDKGPTLTLVQVEENIFGGFSGQSWEGITDTNSVKVIMKPKFRYMNMTTRSQKEFEI